MKTIITAIMLTSVLAACATSPTPGELDSLATIRFGDQIPENQDYILYFEAGQQIPVATVIDGNLIESGVDQSNTVKLKKSIYAYKGWASFDGINWIEGDELMDLFIKVKLPGYHNPNPGLIHLTLDEKKQ